MTEIDARKVVGDSFEDMSIAEMMQVQGSGESQLRASGLLSFLVSVQVSIDITQTILGKC